MDDGGAAESLSLKGHSVPSTAPIFSVLPAKQTGIWMSAWALSLGVTHCGLGELAAYRLWDWHGEVAQLSTEP